MNFSFKVVREQILYYSNLNRDHYEDLISCLQVPSFCKGFPMNESKHQPTSKKIMVSLYETVIKNLQLFSACSFALLLLKTVSFCLDLSFKHFSIHIHHLLIDLLINLKGLQNLPFSSF